MEEVRNPEVAGGGGVELETAFIWYMKLGMKKKQETNPF